MVSVERVADDSRAVQSESPPRVYRVGTLSREQDVLAVAQTAAQRRSAAMLDPFSPGSVRKWSSEPLLNKKTAS